MKTFISLIFISNICLCNPSIEYSKFRSNLSFSESSKDWKSINTIGCIGLFQFTNETLASIGFEYVTTEKFKNNPYIFPKDSQYLAFDKLIMANYFSLKKYIVKYSGKIHNGIKISKAGILAAAHLGGEYRVRIYFDKGIDSVDKYGTKLSDYIKKFGGYKF